MSPHNNLTIILHEGWGRELISFIYMICSQLITTTCNILLQDLPCIMITSITEYMLHYQLEYLEEQNCLKIYNKNIFKKHQKTTYPTASIVEEGPDEPDGNKGGRAGNQHPGGQHGGRRVDVVVKQTEGLVLHRFEDDDSLQGKVVKSEMSEKI